MAVTDNLHSNPGFTGQEAAALLVWWREAGVDTLVSDTPTSWLDIPEEVLVPSPAIVAETPRSKLAKEAPIAQPKSKEDFSSFESLAALADYVQKTWPNTPFADGQAESGLMILGEGPSAEDLRQGRPFTGPAGLFLDRMLRAIGRDRSSAYISLIAPRRRIPGPVPEDAIAADLALTRAHIRLAKPKVLLLLGGPAVQTLTGNKSPISKIRGEWLPLIHPELQSIQAVATYNPAYLLRRPEAKAQSWADLLELKSKLI